MSGVYGADVSTLVSVAGWQSLKVESGVTYGIVRCYESSGNVDPNAPASIENAWAAGLTAVDVYHFPCLEVSAAAQVQAAVGALQAQGARFGTYWFDVETGAGWSTTNFAANASFLSDLIAAAQDLGLAVGIYSSAYMWSQIIDASGFSSYPLWYAEYQTPPSPSFDGFTPFGGWTEPVMKQYAGEVECGGVVYDSNWAPTLPVGSQVCGGGDTGEADDEALRSAVVAYAQSIVGLVGGGATYLKYVSVVANGENLAMQQSMSTLSSCGLTVSGIWCACGYYGAALNAPYQNQSAVSRLLTIGQDAGAWVQYSADALPSPGDMVYIGSGGDDHVYTVVSVTPQSDGAVIQSVDGGFPGTPGNSNGIAATTHSWQNGYDTDPYVPNRQVNGWIDITKVLTSGAMPLTGWIQAAPDAEQGVDTTSTISSSAAASMAAAGLTFCVRYVSPNEDGLAPLTAEEAQGILGAGLGIMLAQRVDASALSFSSSLGTQHGQAAAASAQAVGFPMCAVVWLVLDSLPATTDASALIAYYNAWYDAVYATGYLPGLQVGATAVLTASQLGSSLEFSHYWQACGATVSPSPRGFQLVQGSAGTFGGVAGSADTTQSDNGYGGGGQNQAEWLIATPCG